MIGCNAARDYEKAQEMPEILDIWGQSMRLMELCGVEEATRKNTRRNFFKLGRIPAWCFPGALVEASVDDIIDIR